MSTFVLAFLIGVVAGLRSMTAPAAVSWAARLGWVHLENTWLAFLGFAATPYIISVLGDRRVDQRQTAGDPQPESARTVHRPERHRGVVRRRYWRVWPSSYWRAAGRRTWRCGGYPRWLRVSVAPGMLVLPGPPRIFPIRPWETLGEYARPKRGAKLLYRVGASVFGIPASPGYTKPLGAPGYCVDCWPGTSATILF